MNGQDDFDDLFVYNPDLFDYNPDLFDYNPSPSSMEGAENDNVGAMSGDDDDDEHQDGGRARKIARHTAQQIQELENFFLETPHPSEKRRSEIAQMLNMESRQVKFWFQNKRCQEKAQKERQESTTLKQAYDRLVADHEVLKTKLKVFKCYTCGGPTDDSSSMEQQLLAENARLKQEISSLRNIPIQPPAPANPSSSAQPMISDHPGRYAPLGLDSGGQTLTVQEISNNPIQPPVANPSSSAQPMIFDNPGSYAPLGLGSGGQEISNSPTQPLVANPSSSAQPMILDNPGSHAPLGQSLTLEEISRYLFLASTAVNELTKLGSGRRDNPYWKIDENSTRETLNYEAYKSYFNNGHIIKPPGYVMEASRETGSVYMLPSTLVNNLANLNKWVSMFGPIVTIASAQKITPNGYGGSQNGSLQLIEAEFQAICPFIKKRKVKFLRHCKKLRKGAWAVVDVTLPPVNEETQSLMYQQGFTNRLPSGVIIEDMGYGSSKVTWVEQTEYDESQIEQPYKLLIGSGFGFGAKRWLTTLQRYFDSYSIISYINLYGVNEELSSKGATQLVKLAHRMSLQFYSSNTGSPVRKWVTHHAENVGPNIRFMTRKNVNVVGEHTGVVLSAATCVWLPVHHQTLFHFLSDTRQRNKWDILTKTSSVETPILIQKANCQSNNVSLIHILGNDIRVVQESWSDTSGAYLVYAPVENDQMEAVLLRGRVADYVKILPSGFSLLPDGVFAGGCLLSFGLQVLVSHIPTDKLSQESVKTVVELIDHTIAKIRSAFSI